MFDALGGSDGHTHPEASEFAGETSRLGESGPEPDAISVRPTKAKAGVVDEPGQVATHQHHVFPRARAAWFRERGIDIDDWCIELTPSEHQAQHGGGDWRLARRVANEIPEAEWSAGMMDRLLKEEAQKQTAYRDPTLKLSEAEILEIGERYMDARGVGGLPFQRYKKP